MFRFLKEDAYFLYKDYGHCWILLDAIVSLYLNSECFTLPMTQPSRTTSFPKEPLLKIRTWLSVNLRIYASVICSYSSNLSPLKPYHTLSSTLLIALLFRGLNRGPFRHNHNATPSSLCCGFTTLKTSAHRLVTHLWFLSLKGGRKFRIGVTLLRNTCWDFDYNQGKTEKSITCKVK